MRVVEDDKAPRNVATFGRSVVAVDNGKVGETAGSRDLP